MIEPHINQRFTARGISFIVDFVEDGEVYFRRWKNDKGSNVEPIRMTLEDWNRQLEELQELKPKGKS